MKRTAQVISYKLVRNIYGDRRGREVALIYVVLRDESNNFYEDFFTVVSDEGLTERDCVGDNLANISSDNDRFTEFYRAFFDDVNVVFDGCDPEGKQVCFWFDDTAGKFRYQKNNW